MTAPVMEEIPGASRAVLLPRGTDNAHVDDAPEPDAPTSGRDEEVEEPEPEPKPEQASSPEPAPAPKPALEPDPPEPPENGPEEPLTEPEPLCYPEPPEFTGTNYVKVLFAASILFSAIGQVLFWGTFFTGFAATAFPDLPSAAPWTVAIALGGVFEVGMIVFTDLGLSRRDGRTWDWMWWFGTGIAVSAFCIGINVAHWWHRDATAAITFGAVGALGYVAHLAKGLNRSQRHIQRCREIDEENRRRREAYEAELQRRHDQAEREAQRRHEREMAAFKKSAADTGQTASQQEPAEDSVPNLRSVGSASNPKPSRKTKSTSSRSKSKQSKPQRPALDRAREHFAGTSLDGVTNSDVMNAIGCSKGTASQVLNDLRKERQQSA